MPRPASIGALYAGLYVLAVNSKVPPLDNPLVKQALSLSIDREAIVKELWRGRGIVPSQPIAKGDNHFDASSAAARLQPEGGARAAQEGGLQGRGGHHRDHRRLHGQGQADVRGHPGHVEGRGRQRQGRGHGVSRCGPRRYRDRSFKGMWWSDPTSTLVRPRRDDVASARPRRARRITGAMRSSTSSATPRASRSTRSSAARPTRR